MSDGLALRQSDVQLPVTLVLPASSVMQALLPDVPATLVGVGDGVAPGAVMGVADGVGEGVAVGVGVGGAIADAPSSCATLVARASTRSLTPASSATCVSIAVSLFRTSPDAAGVAVGVGVAGIRVDVGIGVAPSNDLAPKAMRHAPVASTASI